MSLEKALALGLEPKAFFRGFTVAGCEPDEMGIGPVFSVPKLLSKAKGLKIADVDLWGTQRSLRLAVPVLPRPAGDRQREVTTSMAAPSPSATRSA